MKSLACLAIPLLACTATAWGQFNISSPNSGESVTSPVSIAVTDPSCGGQTVIEIAYSLDNISLDNLFSGQTIHTSVATTPGAHTLYLAAWGSSGTCVTFVKFTVTQGSGSGSGSSAGGITVSSPAANAQVATHFTVSAASTTCSSASVLTMGYSLDNAPTALVVQGQSLTAQATAATGAHVLHVKAWGSGTSCSVSVPITVVGDMNNGVPSDALVFAGVAQATNWISAHDDATGSGVTYGDMEFVSSPSLSGQARKFVTTFEEAAGERYSTTFGSDTYTHNFLYDGWVYIAAPNNELANLELDLNQVLDNGNTVILAMQCDGYSGTWDYGENAGSVQYTRAKWLHSSQKCNPRSWTTNTWHHVQISESRDDSGNVTYHSVALDGVQQAINATVPGEFSLGWASVLLTNLQVDGVSSGQATVYLDNLTISTW